MTHDDVRASALEVLAGIAPESAGLALADDHPLREQVDLDSMDYLNFLIGVHERLGVEIPEDDYARCETLDGLLAVVAEAQARPPG